MWIVQSYESKEYKNFKKEFVPIIKEIIKQNKWEMVNEFKHYYLDLEIYFPKTSHDPTNYFKTLQDVNNEILWFDDKIILGRVQRVYYTYNENVKPKIVCTLSPVEYIGIWEDINEYKQFIKKCELCRNYKEGNCKRLKEFTEYRITDDFDIYSRECLGYKEKRIK